MPPMDDVMNNEPMGNIPMNEPMDDNMGEPQDSVDLENGDEEGNDPKKNIQRLAGELSQALRMYNQDQTEPDTDLNKYVMGMIVTQAAKDMTSKEKDEVIKKIQKGETDVEDTDSEADEMPMESIKRTKVNEINDSTISQDRQGKREDKKMNNKNLSKKNPFISNR